MEAQDLALEEMHSRRTKRIEYFWKNLSKNMTMWIRTIRAELGNIYDGALIVAFILFKERRTLERLYWYRSVIPRGSGKQGDV
jgi:hypothetical protein